MIESRRAASATGPSTYSPPLSGPRCASAALIAARRSRSGEPARDAIPQIPHMGRNSTDASVLVAARCEAAQRLLEHAPAGCDDRAQVQADGAVGNPLEIVRELLRHRRLVAAPHLRAPRDPRPDDPSL